MTEAVEAVEAQETFSVDFEEMVHILFKKQGMHQHMEGLMHAAIGISGEAGEIFEAWMTEPINDAHLEEEYGDMEFYMEALRTAAGISDDTLGTTCEALMQKEAGRQYNLADMVNITSSILDNAKRCWVYGTALEDMYATIVTNLAHLTLCMDQMYKAGGTGYEKIRYKNQLKLIGSKGRFRNLVYTDAEARDRADKQEQGE